MSPRKLEVVNGSDRSWTRSSFVLWFGQCAPTFLLVFANGLEDALEEAAGWLADNAPGHIMEDWGDEHKALVREVCAEQEIAFPEGFEALENEEQWAIAEQAEADLTRTESGFLTSYEWGIALEAPDRKTLKAFLAGE